MDNTTLSKQAEIVERCPEDLDFHPAANLFPAMSDAGFAELVEDIRVHGQREPVWVDAYDRVIDGRHRVKACAELKHNVEVRAYCGTKESIIVFVLSLNLKRRHLRQSQRALIAARIANLEQGDNQHTSIEGTSLARAAEQLAVGRASVERAATSLRNGVSELVNAVDAAKVSVSAAAQVATLPKDEQRDVVSQNFAEVKRVARELRQTKSRRRPTEHPAKRDDPLPGAAQCTEPLVQPHAKTYSELDSVERIRLKQIQEWLADPSEAMERAFDEWWCKRKSRCNESQID